MKCSCLHINFGLQLWWAVNGIGSSTCCCECCLCFRQVPQCMLNTTLQQMNLDQQVFVIESLDFSQKGGDNGKCRREFSGLQITKATMLRIFFSQKELKRTYRAASRVSILCLRNVLFSSFVQAILSLHNSICKEMVSGSLATWSIKVRTDVLFCVSTYIRTRYEKNKDSNQSWLFWLLGWTRRKVGSFSVIPQVHEHFCKFESATKLMK